MHGYRTIKITNLLSYYNHAIKYCEKVYERSGKNLFWSIQNSCEVLNKLKSRGFRASSLSTYDFSTLYTTLPHKLIKVRWEQFSAAVRRFLSLRYIMTPDVPFEKKQDGVNVSRFCDHNMVCSQNSRRLSAG